MEENLSNDPLNDNHINTSASNQEEVNTDETECILKRCRLTTRRRTIQSKRFCAKDERNASLKKISNILQKSESDRTIEESQVLNEYSEVVEAVQSRWRKRDEAKRRLEEFEDEPDVLQQKCQILAQAIAQSQHLVVYTGAGISTAAKIPDYRGPNGIWTRLQQGKDIGDHDLSLAEPTYTHMALAELYRRKILKYVVSQNCDGLHLRSGLPRYVLSELHGNMYIEVCKNCKPHREYWRLFDVTENTARYSHKTLRKCYICNHELFDTIVHFGERGNLQWPLNWSGACKNAEQATTILCLGSSLKVLKKYPWLWRMDKPANKRPNLYIVNLQWTPKDDVCNVKIHGKCDDVMKTIMKILDINVPSYDKQKDPIFIHATILCDIENHTTTQPILKQDDIIEIKDCTTTTTIDGDLTTVKTEVCDNNCSNSNCLPNERKDNTTFNDVNPNRNTTFTIDDILHRNTSTIKTTLSPTTTFTNYSPFFNTLSTSLLQYQILGGYTDLLYYPYQTSFLYPGLHSIINPIPVEVEKIQPSCDYCDQQYNSLTCLFYQRTESKFVQPQYRFSKIEQKEKLNACVCCDYTTDEEDFDDKEQNNSATTNELKHKIQAGWFGKGYKKSRRLRRK